MVLNPAGILKEPHLRARNAIVEVEHPKAGRYTMPAAPFLISGAEWRTSRAPLLGEQTDEVLSDMNGATVSAGPAKESGPFRPLDGVRVLDLTTAWAGTSATRALGALGADVIKVESPHSYDGWRGPVLPPKSGRGNYADREARDRPYERTPLFGTANRNKRAIGLHLACDEGRELFLKLLKHADVVLSNFSARVLPNLGLAYESLKSAKDDIIVLAMPAYGTYGPYEHGVGYGNTMEGMSGLSHRFGYEDGAPLITHDLTYGDPVAGAHAAVAVLAALHRRRETGAGAFIDVSQHETLLAQQGEMVVKHSIDGLPSGREGNTTFGYAPHGYYPCRGDDEWIGIAAPDEGGWKTLAAVLEHSPLANDAFATNELRLENRRALDEAISEATVLHDKRELADRLSREGTIAAPVLRLDEVQDDPHIVARRVMEEVDHPEVGVRKYPRLPLTVDGEPQWSTRPTPLFAQHNSEIFGGLLGLSIEELSGLYKRDVIGDLPKQALRR
jgi:crotonobetainyl-CoA:carnitine CoA-transferase CaiB-like acyl-CoA transferase